MFYNYLRANQRLKNVSAEDWANLTPRNKDKILKRVELIEAKRKINKK